MKVYLSILFFLIITLNSYSQTELIGCSKYQILKEKGAPTKIEHDNDGLELLVYNKGDEHVFCLNTLGICWSIIWRPIKSDVDIYVGLLNNTGTIVKKGTKWIINDVYKTKKIEVTLITDSFGDYCFVYLEQ